MNIRDEVKMLLAKESMTMTTLAKKMSEQSNRKYTMKSLSDRLGRKTFRHEEFLLILKILGYSFEYKKLNDYTTHP